MAFQPMPGSTDECAHKLHYATALQAGSAAEWAANRRLPGRWIYICRFCGLYALTSCAPA